MEDFHAVSSGHGHVQNQDIPGSSAHEFKRVIARFSLADGRGGEMLGENILQAVPENGVVINDEDF
jgi:hypothetical protein